MMLHGMDLHLRTKGTEQHGRKAAGHTVMHGTPPGLHGMHACLVTCMQIHVCKRVHSQHPHLLCLAQLQSFFHASTQPATCMSDCIKFMDHSETSISREQVDHSSEQPALTSNDLARKCCCCCNCYSSVTAVATGSYYLPKPAAIRARMHNETKSALILIARRRSRGGCYGTTSRQRHFGGTALA